VEQEPRPNAPAKELENSETSFSALFKITQKLRSAYRELEERFENLNLKLQQTNLELRQSLAAKERIAGHLNEILASLTSGVVAINLDGNVTVFNRAAERILGYPAEEVMGKPYAEVMGKGVKEDLTLPFALKGRMLHSNEKREIYSKTGEQISVGFSTSLLRDVEGEILGAVEVFSDLTRLKQMEEEMARIKTLAAVGEMVAVVAHEVKNPLGGIRGFAELLDRDLTVGDPRKRSVRKIIEGVEAMDRIVMSLLNYTRPVKLNPGRVEMTGFVDEVIGFFEMDASQAKSGIGIVKKYPEDELWCNVDKEPFRQILLNLLHNAVQAMPGGGKIDVELLQEPAVSGLTLQRKCRRAILKISDSGGGMSQGTKEKLFTPFFTTKERGTGLGLATVKKIIEAHQGEIEVESELGKGTTVILKLSTIS
jgi:PAS domain S-box-containing protein